jgi:hypothetical protein
VDHKEATGADELVSLLGHYPDGEFLSGEVRAGKLQALGVQLVGVYLGRLSGGTGTASADRLQ